MDYNSDYEIRLAQLQAMGGDITKEYNSVYEIDLEILKVIEEGGGGGGGLSPEEVAAIALEVANELNEEKNWYGTQEEFDALSEEEKVEGVNYFIEDKEVVDKDNFEITTASDVEKIELVLAICNGQKIDKKILYSKKECNIYTFTKSTTTINNNVTFIYDITTKTTSGVNSLVFNQVKISANSGVVSSSTKEICKLPSEWIGTQEQFDALSSKSASITYYITEN